MSVCGTVKSYDLSQSGQSSVGPKLCVFNGTGTDCMQAHLSPCIIACKQILHSHRMFRYLAGGQKSRAQNGISIGKRMDAEMVWKINFLDFA
jgi:hypothetical protein